MEGLLTFIFCEIKDKNENRMEIPLERFFCQMEDEEEEEIMNVVKDILTHCGATDIRYYGSKEEGRTIYHDFEGECVGQLLCFNI